MQTSKINTGIVKIECFNDSTTGKTAAIDVSGSYYDADGEIVQVSRHSVDSLELTIEYYSFMRDSGNCELTIRVYHYSI